MNENTATMPRGYRALGTVTAPTGTVLIVPSAPQARVLRWVAVLWTERRSRRRVQPRRHPDNFEAAAMAREMYRL